MSLLRLTSLARAKPSRLTLYHLGGGGGGGGRRPFATAKKRRPVFGSLGGAKTRNTRQQPSAIPAAAAAPSPEMIAAARLLPPQLNPERFDQAVNDQLDRVRCMVDDLGPGGGVVCEPAASGGVTLTCIGGGTVRGAEFEIIPDADAQVLRMQSPVSGERFYTVGPDGDVWQNLDDRHDFEGIVVRDLMRHVLQGLPEFRAR